MPRPPGSRRPTSPSRPGSRRPTSRACTRSRTWSCSRRCYEGFGLPVLEAMARGVPVALRSRLAARGGGRRGAAGRPDRPDAIAGGDRALLLDDPPAERLRHAGPRAREPVHLGADRGADAGELRARARAARVARRRRPRVRASRRATAASRCARTSRAVDPRSSGPPSSTRVIAVGQLRGRRPSAPRTRSRPPRSAPSRRCPRPHDHARRARRGRLDHDEPVALAARREDHAAARRSAARPRRPPRSRAARRPPSRPSSRTQPPHRLALGTVAEDHAARAPGASRVPRRPRDDRRHPLLRDVAPGEHHERLGAAAGSRPRASRRTTLEDRDLAAHAALAQARACSREKQNARWGTRRHSAWTASPIRPPTRPEVLDPVATAPDLVPVDHERGIRPCVARARPRAARSTGTRPCAPRRSAPRAGAGARARPRRRRAAAGSACARRGVQRHPRPDGDHPHAGTSARSTPLPLPQRQVRHVVSSAARRSARFRYQRSAPPTV